MNAGSPDAVDEHVPRGGGDGVVGRGVLGGDAAVHLAGGGVADLVVPGPRVRPLVRRVGARRHRLRADRLDGPQGRHLQRDHASQVVLERQHVDRVAGRRPRRGRGRAQPAAVGLRRPARQLQPDRPAAGVELRIARQHRPAAPLVRPVGHHGGGPRARLESPRGRAVRGQPRLLAGDDVLDLEPAARAHHHVVGGVGGDEHLHLAPDAPPAGAGVVELRDLVVGQPLARGPLGAVLRQPVAVPVAVPLDHHGRRPRHRPRVRRRGRCGGHQHQRGREACHQPGRRGTRAPSRGRGSGVGAGHGGASGRGRRGPRSHHAGRRPRSGSTELPGCHS